MMKKALELSMVALTLLCAGSACLAAAGTTHDGRIIPPETRDYGSNHRWDNRLCGRGFWVASVGYYEGATRLLRQMDQVESLAYWGPPSLAFYNRVWGEGAHEKLWKDPIVRRRFELIEAGELPVLANALAGVGRKETVYNGTHFVSERTPTKTEVRDFVQRVGRGFLGWAPFTEWGNCVTGFLEAAEGRRTLGPRSGPASLTASVEALFSDFTLPIDNREDFIKAAMHAWRAANEPYDYQVAAYDGTSFWAIQWPAIGRARSIITENRCPSRNCVEYQAFTRAAGRMGNIPWGFGPAHDWRARPVRIPTALMGYNPKVVLYPGVRRGQGWLHLHPSFYRRTCYYMAIGDAAFIRDEQTHSRYVDLDGDGNCRLSWYGLIWQEAMDFLAHYGGCGTPYTPVGVLLGWDNGYEPWGSKAFFRFDYNDGEHMTRELFHRVIFPSQEGRGNEQDMFGPTPHGDLFDPLRIDTPEGPLPLELLENYRVLFCAGKQNLDKAVADRLKEYVRQGGTLVVNVKQLTGELGVDFTGIEPAKEEREAKTMACVLDGERLTSGTFRYAPLTLRGNATALYRVGTDDVVVSRYTYEKGVVIVVGAHWMLESKKDITSKTEWHAHIMKYPEERRRVVRAHMLPVADDLMGRLVKELVPFEIRGKQVRERVLYQVNRKGKGWVIALYNNSGRQTQNAQGPEVVWPDKYVEVELAADAEFKDAAEWIRRERLALTEKDGVKVLRLGIPPGDLRVVEIQPDPIPPVRAVEAPNLALKQPATASSTGKDTHRGRALSPKTPERAVDGDLSPSSAWWSYGHCPQWLQVDLGAVKKIGSVRTVMLWSENNDILPRIYQFYVESSTDGQNWTKLYDETKNLSTAQRRGYHRHFDPVKARYVRVTVTHSTAFSGGQIVEFEVYGDTKAEREYPWRTP